MAGCHEAGWDLIRILLEHGIRFSYFVSITEEKAIEQKVSGYKSFEDLSSQYGIPIYFAKKYSLKDDEDVSFFREHNFDLLIQGGWQRLFPENIINTLSVGAIGVHGSMDFLPFGRGRSPINWSLIEGRQRFIFQYFLMKPGIDDGEIFHYEMVDINQWDDCATLYLKNTIVTAMVFKKHIPILLSGNFATYPQVGHPHYYEKRTVEDGIIDWKRDVFEIYNLIRAVTRPYPGSFSHINGQKITIWKAQPFDTRMDSIDMQCGEIIWVEWDQKKFIVKCLGGTLLVNEYEGSSEIQVGDVFK